MHRVAIVTGAARGIGFAICKELIRKHYNVVAVDIDDELGQKRASDVLRDIDVELRDRAPYRLNRTIFMKCDVSSREEFEAVFKKTKETLGRIDLLINNAAILDEQNPKRTVQVNLIGPIYGCELAIEYMGTSNGGKGGCVINVSSTKGLVPYPDAPTYVATKHALIGLTRSYGHQAHFEKNGITFMAVCPHCAHTDLLREAVTLGIYDNVYLVAMRADIIADFMLYYLLNDRSNGSVLLILHDERKYVEIPENLRELLP